MKRLSHQLRAPGTKWRISESYRLWYQLQISQFIWRRRHLSLTLCTLAILSVSTDDKGAFSARDRHLGRPVGKVSLFWRLVALRWLVEALKWFCLVSLSRCSRDFTASRSSKRLLPLGAEYPKQEPPYELPRGNAFLTMTRFRGVDWLDDDVPLFVGRFSFVSGLSWSELQERSRTLSGEGQSCRRRTASDFLQSRRPGKWILLPQCAEDHLLSAGGPEDLTSTEPQEEWLKKKKTKRQTTSVTSSRDSNSVTVLRARLRR